MTAARHPPDVRAKAAAALLVGERPAAVARDLGVPEGTVRSWKHRVKNGSSATLKKGDFGGLLLQYLEASLRSLVAQSEELADPSRLAKMRAGDVGVLYGTLFDRTMRIFEMAPAFGVGRAPPQCRGARLAKQTNERKKACATG